MRVSPRTQKPKLTHLIFRNDIEPHAQEEKYKLKLQRLKHFTQCFINFFIWKSTQSSTEQISTPTCSCRWTKNNNNRTNWCNRGRSGRKEREKVEGGWLATIYNQMISIWTHTRHHNERLDECICGIFAWAHTCAKWRGEKPTRCSTATIL